MEKRNWGIVVGIFIVLIGVFYIANIYQKASSSQQDLDELAQEPQVDEVDWRDAEVEDVLTGNKIKISDYNRPVILESFAVWCPTCKKQQDKIKELHEDIGDEAISISFDTDPNEDASQVISHANRHGFDWIFVVSPTEVTKSLINEFGIGVVNAPSAPVVIVCPDGQANFLKSGVKSADEIKQELNSC